MTNRNLLPLSARDLMNYAYCKRIPYFERVLHATQTTTIKEIAGREKHVREARLEKRRSSHKRFSWTRKIRDLRLESEKTGSLTVLDLLLIDDFAGVAIPMQFKNTAFPGFVYRGQRHQIIFESILVEEKLGFEVPFGLIKYLGDGKIVRIETDREKKRQLMENLMELNRLITQEVIPEPTDQLKKCSDCCFRRICARA